MSSSTPFGMSPAFRRLPSGVVDVNDPAGDEKDPMTVSFIDRHCTSLLMLLNLVCKGPVVGGTRRGLSRGSGGRE